MKTAASIFLILLPPGLCSAQDNPAGQASFLPFKLTSFSGEIKAKGTYREQETFRPDYYFLQKSYFGSGGILIKTKSFILHPDFLSLDAGGEYSPETNREKNLVLPAFSEVRTLKRMDIRATFLDHKPVSLITFFNLNSSYSNRENLTDIRSDSKNWGGLLLFTNKVFPFNLNYNKTFWEQEEIQTNRYFKYRQNNFEARTSKTLWKNNQNDLTYFHHDFWRQEIAQLPVHNITDNVNLNNAIFFNSQRTSRLNSTVTAADQKGNDRYKKLQVNENLYLPLRNNFTFKGNYKLYSIQWPSQELAQQNLSGNIGKKVYLSLNAALFYEYNKTVQSSFNESNHKSGIDLRYTKKIPAKGRLTITYAYYRLHQERESRDIILQTLNEEYKLTDGEIVLLNKPYVDPQSVMVTDATSTIVYTDGVDYILIERDNFLEIKRISGGQISNNGSIYIDYIAIQPGTYRYDINNHSFYSGISLFNRLVEIYYRALVQDYANLQKTDYLILNYIRQNVYGCTLQHKYAGCGIEYNDNNSSILPYRMIRYFFNMQGNFKGKVQTTLSGNLKNYQMVSDNTKQNFSDIAGVITYVIRQNVKVNITGGYQKQNVRQVSLDLVTGKSEITADYRQWHLSAGLELYRRMQANEEINFNGIFISIVRKF
ncbi:MAG: hypothetical protein HYY40_08330 [Bacteroidetes bacterium]|nr:hypothetical protein [Bacteroidota bacterium]